MFQCVICGVGVAKGDYIDKEADHGRMDTLPMAVVAEGGKGRSICHLTLSRTRLLRGLKHCYPIRVFNLGSLRNQREEPSQATRKGEFTGSRLSQITSRFGNW